MPRITGPECPLSTHNGLWRLVPAPCAPRRALPARPTALTLAAEPSAMRPESILNTCRNGSRD